MRSVNVVELLARHGSESVAFVCGDESRTYGALLDRVASGRTEVARHASVGTTIMVLGDTSIDFIESVFAGLSAGLPIVPLSPRYPQAEIERAIELARPQLVISTDPEAARLAEGLGIAHLESTGLFSAEAASGELLEPVHLEPDHPALLMFTSGTAGRPRVAVLTHKNIAASIQNSIESAPTIRTEHQTILGVMPLTHVLGIVSVVAVAVAVGATIVLATDVDVDSVARQVKDHQVTFLVGPPVFWFRLANSELDPESMASVNHALSGAAPLSGSVAVALEEQFGMKLRQGYGLTEASPGLTSAIGTEAPATSVGRPMPNVELRLVDEFGDDALVGDVGEVWARGDNIFAGYLGDDDATAEVIDPDGWLHTGDLAIVDEHGFLFIVGRNKDQIIVSGFNVHPAEVEERLVEHDSVEAAAVVGAPDREYGEIVIAYVVPAAGRQIEPEVLEAHCRKRLAGYKVPRRFETVDALPRGSAAGKIRRRVLRNS